MERQNAGFFRISQLMLCLRATKAEELTGKREFDEGNEIGGKTMRWEWTLAKLQEKGYSFRSPFHEDVKFVVMPSERDGRGIVRL